MNDIKANEIVTGVKNLIDCVNYSHVALNTCDIKDSDSIYSPKHIAGLINDTIRPVCNKILIELPGTDVTECDHDNSISEIVIDTMAWVYRWMRDIIQPCLQHLKKNHPDNVSISAIDKSMDTYSKIGDISLILSNPDRFDFSKKISKQDHLVSTIVDNYITKGAIKDEKIVDCNDESDHGSDVHSMHSNGGILQYQ